MTDRKIITQEKLLEEIGKCKEKIKQNKKELFKTTYENSKDFHYNIFYYRKIQSLLESFITESKGFQKERKLWKMSEKKFIIFKINDSIRAVLDELFFEEIGRIAYKRVVLIITRERDFADACRKWLIEESESKTSDLEEIEE